MRNVGGVYLQVDSDGAPGKTILHTFLSIKDEHLPGIFGFCAPTDDLVILLRKFLRPRFSATKRAEPILYMVQLTCADRESLLTAYNKLICITWRQMWLRTI